MDSGVQVDATCELSSSLCCQTFSPTFLADLPEVTSTSRVLLYGLMTLRFQLMPHLHQSLIKHVLNMFSYTRFQSVFFLNHVY